MTGLTSPIPSARALKLMKASSARKPRKPAKPIKLVKLDLPTPSKRSMQRFRKQMKFEDRQYRARLGKLRSDFKRFKKLSRLEQYDVAARIVGDFQGTDGYAYLIYADSGCHKLSDERCKGIVGKGNHSCHLHLGLMGSGYDEFYPKGRRWPHGKQFCAQGETRDKAIARALKLAGFL